MILSNTNSTMFQVLSWFICILLFLKHIQALWDGKQFLNTISVSEEQFGIIVDKSNFYAESGGQIYDIGVISTKDTQFQVKNVQAYAGYLLHTGMHLFPK